VFCGDRQLSAYAGGRKNSKPWEILAYLAAQPTAEINRDRVLARFWPDEDEETAGSRLNTHLMRVRKLLTAQVPELRSAVVRSNGRTDGTISLDTLVASSDVKRFVHLWTTARRLPPPQRRAALEEAHALYRGDLLSEAGYGWVYDREDGGQTLQERYRTEFKALTKALAQLYLDEGEAARAAELCRSVLRSEPLAEDVLQMLYRAYGALGDVVALQREHRRLLQALRDVNGGESSDTSDTTSVQPERTTVRVYEEVLAALTGATPQAPRSPAPREPVSTPAA
jgi:two-component SAPR family response regulator